jgi:propionyl-CoA carboxylase alpha chain
VDGQLNGHGASYGEDWVVVLDKQATPISISDTGEGFTVQHDGHTHHVSTGWRPGQSLAHVQIDGREIAVQVERKGLGYRLSHQGSAHHAIVYTTRGYALSKFMIEKVPPDLSRFLLCPMPGLVVSVDVSEGQSVEAGQPLAVVEAMKMQNILRAEKKATVKTVRAKAGDSLAVDAIILEFE